MEIAAFVIGLLVVAGAINAGLARKKGRNGLFWGLISLLLGPVATLLIVVLPKVGFS